MDRRVPVACVVLATAICIGCRPQTVAVSEKPIGKPIEIKAPLGLPPVPIPADNPVTAETVALGRKLFYEKKLSADNTISCSMCHSPQLGFSDGRKFSLGVAGKRGTRNAPTVINAAYSTMQFWDGRAASLELQAAGPIANPVEMNQPHDVSVSKLAADPEYKQLFLAAFGPGPVTIGKVEKSIASFERTVVSGNSPFDRYYYGGDKTALSPAAIRGLAVFTDKARGNCSACHTIGEKYALFTDGKFHNIGVGVNSEGELTDPGRYAESKAEVDRGAFKTPSLRNVGLSAPYMHDGSLKTLKDVIDFYKGGGNSNPNLDKEIKELKLTAQDKEDLMEFLESLTGDVPADAGPPKS
jgi:cytochrome c peroxidase